MNNANPRPIHIVHGTGAAVVLCITALLYLFVCSPLWTQQQDSSRLANQLSTQQSNLERSQRAQRALASQLEKVTSVIADRELPLKDPSALNEELAALTSLAAQNNVQIESMLPGTSRTNGRFRVLTIQMSGRGQYRAVYSLFQAIRKTLPDTSIRGFSLTDDNTARPPMGVMELELVWITKPNPAGSFASVR